MARVPYYSVVESLMYAMVCSLKLTNSGHLSLEKNCGEQFFCLLVTNLSFFTSVWLPTEEGEHKNEGRLIKEKDKKLEEDQNQEVERVFVGILVRKATWIKSVGH